MSDKVSLTGNAIVGQSGGPTAAINASLAGVIRAAQAAPEIEHIYGMKNGVEGLINGVEPIDISLSETELRMLSSTPASALGSCRHKIPDDFESEEYKKLEEIFDRLNIKYFFYIGGNDSMDTVYKLSKYCEIKGREMRVIGVPKTIDNDLTSTDHTPGYGSAAKYIAITVQEVLRDCAVYTKPAVTIIEIMGRDAGWLTASAALTGAIAGIAPDYIYLPEKPFDKDSFLEDVKSALKTHPNVVIAISEGIRNAEGNYIGAALHKGKDVFGNVNLSGAGKALELLVKDELGCKVRSIEINLLQRCASHAASLTDINESERVGEAAVKAALNGETAKMMCFIRSNDSEYSVDIISRDITSIANQTKTVPDNYINESNNHITEEGIKYMLPLIQGELPLVWENGIPKHFSF
jgi:6-phosphofructokinase 1